MKKRESDNDGEVSLEELESSRREHARELKRLEKMSDQQFEAFKKNFSLGKLDPSLGRREAMEILRSMICTNLSLQQEKRSEHNVANEASECYSKKDSERE